MKVCVLKVKVISLPYIFKVLYVLCFTRPRYQVSVYRIIGPLVLIFVLKHRLWVPIEAAVTCTRKLCFEQKQTIKMFQLKIVMF